jgi:hypothetical protein
MIIYWVETAAGDTAGRTSLDHLRLRQLFRRSFLKRSLKKLLALMSPSSTGGLFVGLSTLHSRDAEFGDDSQPTRTEEDH